MFSICFLFLVSPFYVYFFIFCGLTHHPPPATRHPLPATRHPSTRYPPPATRHPLPVTRRKVLPTVSAQTIVLYCYLLRRKCCSTLGACSFAAAGAAPVLWNKLPADVRNVTSLNSFKKSIKTFLFNNSL